MRKHASLGSRRARAVIRGLAGNTHGAAAVEMALISMPLITFLFGIIAVGQLMWRQNALDESVAQAARCASIDATRCGTTSLLQTYAASLTGAGFDTSIYSVSAQPCGNQVSASYPLALTIPFMSFSVTLRAQACYPA
ncbi:MAG TPA: TadE family protein [Stellaceae bacterium]|nr:TadE family protein [Stellaceae bacterium]